jgi:hypothetical protein
MILVHLIVILILLKINFWDDIMESQKAIKSPKPKRIMLIAWM